MSFMDEPGDEKLVSDRAIIARITEKAKRAWWPDIDLYLRKVVDIWVIETGLGDELMTIDHTRGLEAMEAALDALNDQPSPQHTSAIVNSDRWQARAEAAEKRVRELELRMGEFLPEKLLR